MAIKIRCQHCGQLYELKDFLTRSTEKKRANITIEEKLKNRQILLRAKCSECGKGNYETP